jgi:O-antigen ligase
MRLRLVPLVAAAMLWGVFTMKFQVLFALGMLAAGTAFAAVGLLRGRLDRIGLLLVANFGYWLASGLMIGGIQGADLLSFDFWNGDGRIFFYYVPLLFFSVVASDDADRETIVLVTKAMLGAGIALFFVFSTTHLRILSGSGVGGTGAGTNFYGFLTSHTGSGTFWASLSVFLVILGTESANTATVVLGVLGLLPTFGSGSREALLGFSAVIAWYTIRRASAKLVLRIAVIGTIAVAAVPAVAPHTYDRVVGILNEQTLEAAIQTVRSSDWEPGRNSEVEGADFNVLTRMLYWSYATKRFLDSPILGMGWGRFNDVHVEISGVKGVYYFATEGDVVNSVVQAHNSYLHMLCETGIVGLLLLCGIWFMLFQRMRRGANAFADEPSARAFFVACQALIIFTMSSALVAHGLGAPSIGVVTLTIVGAGASQRCFRRSLPLAAMTTSDEGRPAPGGVGLGSPEPVRVD